MADYSLSYTLATAVTGKTKDEKYQLYHNLKAACDDIRNNGLVAHSKIESATLEVSGNLNTSSTPAMMGVYWLNSSGNYDKITTSDQDIQIGGKLGEKWTTGLSVTSKFESENSNSGYIKSSYGGTNANHVRVSFVHAWLLSSFTYSTKYKLTISFNKPRAIVSVSKSGEGDVTGAGTYHWGNSYTITATPATGYRFVKWSDGNTNASRTFTVDSSLITAYETSKSYQAVFEKQSYTISTAVSPSGSGTVTGGGSYAYGATATLTATPATNYRFVKWTDGNTSATRTVTVSGAATYTATFEIITHTISTAVSPTGSGTVTGGGRYNQGSTATLTATPATGWKFKQWNDGNTSNPRTVTVSGAATYTATFEKLTYRVRWYNEDGSSLLETDSAVPYGDTPTYNGATPTKTDPTGKYTYAFAGWNISPTAEGTTGLTAVVANVDYYARFTATMNSYTVTWENEGNVIETDTQVPHGDPPDYNGPIPTKASTAQYDYTFLGWSANVEDPPLDESDLPTVSGNITYTAVYLPIVRTYDLDIVAYDCTVEGAVNGTYEYGTEFTITVKPDFGFEFDKISDISNDVEYTDSTVTFILTGDTSLLCICKRTYAPIFASSEQQVKDVYFVPAINTIVYELEGVLPTLEIKMHTVDDLHFAVINTSIENSVYEQYEYYSVDKLFVNDEDGNVTRIW